MKRTAIQPIAQALAFNSSIAVRQSTPAASRTAILLAGQNCRTCVRQPFVTHGLHVSSRWSSSSAEGSSKQYTFEDIQKIVAKPDPNRILIDTREPGELQSTGRIPTALNIPISSQADAFFISEDEFEDRVGFERPGKDKEVVFYCKAGVRSRAAAQLARQAGWEKTGEYAGSWLDWERNGGESEKA